MKTYAVDLAAARVWPVDEAPASYDLVLLSPHEPGSGELIAALALAIWHMDRPPSAQPSSHVTDKTPSPIL